MCNLYEYEMTAEVMPSIKDHFNLVGTAYLDVLRGRNGPTNVYPNYEAPVIRSLATPEGVVRDIVLMRWGFPAPPFYDFKGNITNVRKSRATTGSAIYKPATVAWCRRRPSPSRPRLNSCCEASTGAWQRPDRVTVSKRASARPGSACGPTTAER